MKITIASDHHGVDKRKKVIKYLRKLGHDVIDFGPNETGMVDFTEYAFKVGESVTSDSIDLGILFCGSGIGMSIAVNKVDGVRGAKLNSVRDAKFAKHHNNANVITFSAREPMFKVKDMIDTFIKTKVSEVERYHIRNKQIEEYENAR